MDKEIRNRIQKATQGVRKLLEEEYREQLEGTFDIMLDGTVAEAPGSHLDAREKLVRGKIVAAVEHNRAGGISGADAVAMYLREAAFTTLNRFVALKMLEARGLVQDCISREEESSGFKEFIGLAAGLNALPDHGYRLYIESLFDEIGREIRVLFSRNDPVSLLWPRRQALNDLLDILNHEELSGVWAEDETLGWVYQYFNSSEERKAMRDPKLGGSQAPRNSRELAVRNQFFTPRYVVEFLADNTLGRIWYEMRQSETSLKYKCRYLVRRPDEVFLYDAVQKEVMDWLLGKQVDEPELIHIAHSVDGYRRAGGLGERAEAWVNEKLDKVRNEGAQTFQTQELLDTLFVHHRADRFSEGYLKSHGLEADQIMEVLRDRVAKSRCTDLSQEELLGLPVFVPFREKKDPRDLKILDPACGSGHFLLYAFDLLERIYQEAWKDDDSPSSEDTGKPLNEDYETIEGLKQNIPKLIMEHNLHGIDIDARAVQIAALALWIRAQRSWKELGVKAAGRPRISKSNIVTAEPMPGDEKMLREFTAGLKPRVLGQIVDEVFEKMKLAGEAGSLLKIGEEIKDAVDAAKRQWGEDPKPEQQLLFPTMDLNRPQQQQLRFDLKGITDERFWEQAEDRILDALRDYAEQAENGQSVRRRLFAEDAARGFAFIDLCRKRYDAVLMNPPFGEFSKTFKVNSRITYPNSYNDILAAFVDRWLLGLENGGRLGAITARTCFFLTSFNDWREKAVLAESALAAVADLGQGVMDNAMVEAAAYILERSQPIAIIPFIRAIVEKDRELTVSKAVSAINSGISEPHLLLAQQDTFRKLPDTPFVYWVEADDLDRFAALPAFEPEAAEVRQGLATGDDPRFVRAVWEVSQEDTQFVYYPANGDTFCRLDDPIVLAYYRRRQAGTPRWAFHVKSGASQPWHSPITLKIDWHQDGLQLRNFRDSGGKLRSRPQNIAYYFRPGFSWTRRAARFYPYVIPGSCIPSVSRYMAFPKHGREYDALGISASRIASAFMRFYGEKFEWPNFLVENLKGLPWPELPKNAQQFFRGLIQREVEQRRRAYMNHEPFQEFLLPIKVRDFSNGGRSLAFEPKTLLGEEGERFVAEAYGFDQEAVVRIERDVIEALDFQCGIEESDKDADGENDEQDSNEDTDFVLDYSKQSQLEAFLSYCFGCIYGRWDVRMALDQSLAPRLPDTFDPLPVCPPGMLIGPDGLPAKPNRIVSEDWLHNRPNANSLPPEGSLESPTIQDSDYPLPISWNGILVDDAGFTTSSGGTVDLVDRVREAIAILWQEKVSDIEQEVCEIMGVSDLRDYFRKPSGFFQDHLKRYFKSRRKAPIYWQLATPSSSYSIWLYYHRFNRDTMYKVLNDYVSPKLEHEERRLTRMTQEYGPEPTAGQRKELAAQETFVEKLRAFKREVARVAPLWNPDLNDGVIINYAPLWRMIPLTSWQKDCKTVWDKLVKGDYDWAHLAMHLWPERVVPKCAKDRSLAIAHGLDEVFWEEDEKGRAKSKKVLKEEIQKLIEEHTSTAVKAALEDLLRAPAMVGTKKGSGRKKNKS